MRVFLLATVLLLAWIAGCGAPDPADPSVDAPRTVPPLPHPRHGHRVGRLGDRLVVVGGFAATQARDRGTRQTWMLDRRADEPAWTRGPDLRTGKAFFGADVVDGVLLAVGEGGLERLGPDEASWALLDAGRDLPDTHLGAAALDGVLYVVGGHPAPTGGLRAWDVEAGHVVDVAALPGFEAGDHFHVVAALAGGLHVAGGLTDRAGGPSRQHWRLRGGRWTERAPPPDPLWAKFAATGVLQGRLHVFTESTALRYDPGSDTWHRIAPLDVPYLAMPGCVVWDDTLVVLGGQTPEGPCADVRIYDPDADAWRRVTKGTPRAKREGTADD